MKKLHLELGGKGFAVVADDADIALASKKILEGALKFSGQRCDAISRVLPFASIHEELVAQIMKDITHWKLGDPRKEGITMGPLINEGAANRVQELVDDAVTKGALLLQGGSHKGTYFEPTVLDNVPLDAKIAWEETFGPVVTIIPVRDLDNAIRIVNESHYGLDSCIFTENLYTAWKAAKSFEEGSVAINDAPAHGVGYFPFGGNKDSGLGREGVGHSIDEMTRLKTIQFNLAPAGLGKVRQQAEDVVSKSSLRVQGSKGLPNHLSEDCYRFETFGTGVLPMMSSIMLCGFIPLSQLSAVRIKRWFRAGIATALMSSGIT